MAVMDYMEWMRRTATVSPRKEKLAALDGALLAFSADKTSATAFISLWEAFNAWYDDPGSDAEFDLRYGGLGGEIEQQIKEFGLNVSPLLDPTQAGRRGDLLNALRTFDRSRLRDHRTRKFAPVGPVLPGRLRFESCDRSEEELISRAWLKATECAALAEAAIDSFTASLFEQARFRYFFCPDHLKKDYYDNVKDRIHRIGDGFRTRNITFVNAKTLEIHVLDGDELAAARAPTAFKGFIRPEQLYKQHVKDYVGVVHHNYFAAATLPPSPSAPAAESRGRAGAVFTRDPRSRAAAVTDGSSSSSSGSSSSSSSGTGDALRWRILLGAGFWRRGPLLQAHCVYHEMSHKAVLTRDHRYDVEPCHRLARENPLQAAENADNFAYYAASFLILPPCPTPDSSDFRVPDLSPGR